MTEISDHRKPLGVTLARLERSYRVRAETGVKDVHQIITSDRARAIKYLKLFASSAFYVNPTIELGSASYSLDNLEQMP